MANQKLFKSWAGKSIPAARERNEAGGPAYAFPSKQALAQYVATGCLNSTFYASAEEQLEKILRLCARVEPEFHRQDLIAYKAAGAEVPASVREALQDAMEAATGNVPALPGKVYVCPDVSGSMQSPVTGARSGSTTAARCIDVAALVAASVLRVNRQAEVLPFENDVVEIRLNPRDSVMTNAEKLAAIGGGGTNCGAPLARLNQKPRAGRPGGVCLG